ncbi:MAG: M48 family metalloprotease [Actinobacteria bacterium]|nr:M48 family metalloprotease [Actinomycetota bacterium]MBU1944585.1 M48 family metalloprotease [Actinomycetota bacterium]MBU2689138.1 M48 family metalloprotease [Actinomycetota bacterium]
MKFEPQIEKSLRKYRNRARLRVGLALLPLVPILLIIGYQVFNAFRLSSITGRYGHSNIGWAVVAEPLLIVGILAILFPAAYYFAVLKPLVQQYRSLSRGTPTYDRHRLHLFQEAAEAAAIAAGVRPPHVVPVGMPTANALTFEVGGRPAVGVTPEMLDAKLSGPEVEVVMAHQVAHIAAHTGLKAPIALKPRTLVLVTLVALLLPVAVAIALNNPFVAMLPLFVIPVAPLWLGIIVQPYMPWKQLTYYQRVRGATAFSIWTGQPKSLPEESELADMNVQGPGHNETLFADTLASKMTSNPRAMLSALKKLMGLMEVAEAMPTQTLAFPHLFIPPLKPWESPPPPSSLRVASFLMRPRGAPIPTPGLIAEEMKAFNAVSRNLLSERLRNLEGIIAGLYHGIEEVVGGEIRSRPDAWE